MINLFWNRRRRICLFVHPSKNILIIALLWVSGRNEIHKKMLCALNATILDYSIAFVFTEDIILYFFKLAENELGSAESLDRLYVMKKYE